MCVINTCGPDHDSFCFSRVKTVLRAVMALVQGPGYCGGKKNNIHEKILHCTLIPISCVYCKQINELLLALLCRKANFVHQKTNHEKHKSWNFWVTFTASKFNFIFPFNWAGLDNCVYRSHHIKDVSKLVEIRWGQLLWVVCLSAVMQISPNKAQNIWGLN